MAPEKEAALPGERIVIVELKIRLPPGISGLLVPLSQKSKKGSWGFGWGTVYYSPGREGSVTLEFSRSLTKVLGDSIGQRPCQLKLTTATGIYSVVKNNYKNNCDHMAKCRNESII